MHLHHIRYFIAVAETLNFTEAAKQLYVAQSSVSQQIAYLEEEIGVKLFIRNKRSVQLTNAGVIFLNEAKEILNRANHAVELAKKAEKGIIGKLNVGFLAAPVRKFLPPLIKQFSIKYPQIELNLFHLTLAELNNKLNTFDLDIVFAVSLGFQDIEDLEYKPLFSSSPCVYMHSGHALAIEKRIKLSNLAQETFVFRAREEAPQWYDYALGMCAKSGFTPNIINQPKRIETVLLFVEAGMGITIFPDYIEMYASPNIRIIGIEGENETFDVGLYRKISNENPTISLFLEELDQVLEDFML